MSNEIKEKEEYEKYARDHRKELDAQEVKLGDVVTVLVGHFAGEKGIIVGMIACDKSDYADPYYEIEMECDVPEEFRVRKTLIGQSRVIGGVEKRYLKVIGNRAPKEPSMEIKQGDKVRVSKDALLETIKNEGIPTAREFTVTTLGGYYAEIKLKGALLPTYFCIPTKYLVKVDAEAKEAKIKLGDIVRIKGNLHEPFCLDAGLPLEITNIPPHAVSQKEWKVIKVENRRDCAGHIYTLNNGDSFIYNIPGDCLERAEPTEQTEAEEDAHIRQMEAEFDELRKAHLDRTLNPEEYYTYEVTIDNVAINWQSYKANLAKEVVLKVVNKYEDPKIAAEYAVSVAKAVVEGLKRK